MPKLTSVVIGDQSLWGGYDPIEFTAEAGISIVSSVLLCLASVECPELSSVHVGNYSLHDISFLKLDGIGYRNVQR